MVDEPCLFLGFAVPAQGIFFIAFIESRIGAEGAEEATFIVWRATHPAPRDALPLGNGVAGCNLLFDGVRRAVETMSKTAPFGWSSQNVFACWVMQGIVHPGNHSRRVSECRVLGDIVYSLAIYPDFSAIVQALEIFLSGKRNIVFIETLLCSCRNIVVSGDIHFIKTSSGELPRAGRLNQVSYVEREVSSR
ncbi:hypothetical protein D3C87_1590540 [compost metagenome]